MIKNRHQLRRLIRERLQSTEPTKGVPFATFCIKSRITYDEYFEVEAEAFRGEMVQEQRQETRVMADNLTNLELRLWCNIPAYVFYNFTQQPWWSMQWRKRSDEALREIRERRKARSA